MSNIFVSQEVQDLLGLTREEVGKLTIDDLTDMVLERGYDIEIAWRHAVDVGRLRVVMGQTQTDGAADPAVYT